MQKSALLPSKPKRERQKASSPQIIPTDAHVSMHYAAALWSKIILG
jgi:hypothetical protein